MPPLHKDESAPPLTLVTDEPAFPVDTTSNGAAPGSPSLQDLTAARREGDRRYYLEMRARFEATHGAIVEEYFAPDGDAAALLLKKRRLFRSSFRYRIVVAHDVPLSDPRICGLIRRLRLVEGQALRQLDRGAHDVLCRALFDLVVCLLSALQPPRGTPVDEREHLKRIGDTTKTVEKELVGLAAFIARSARRTALGCYLIGCLPGAVIGFALVWCIAHSQSVQRIVEGRLLAMCVATGAIGAVISVMTRVTRGERIRVDSEKGKGVTLLAGGCRPIVGGVLGGALYVFVCAGILPLTLPAPDRSALFFAGLAFLAGFSERWAQDTIVGSAPKTG